MTKLDFATGQKSVAIYIVDSDETVIARAPIEHEEWAERICCAVNNHQALVEALRNLCGAIEGEANGNEGMLRPALRQAREALEQAKC